MAKPTKLTCSRCGFKLVLVYIGPDSIPWFACPIHDQKLEIIVPNTKKAGDA